MARTSWTQACSTSTSRMKEAMGPVVCCSASGTGWHIRCIGSPLMTPSPPATPLQTLSERTPRSSPLLLTSCGLVRTSASRLVIILSTRGREIEREALCSSLVSGNHSGSLVGANQRRLHAMCAPSWTSFLPGPRFERHFERPCPNLAVVACLLRLVCSAIGRLIPHSFLGGLLW